MATLDASFESDLRDAMLDDAEDKLYDGSDTIAEHLLRTANENLDDYATEYDYSLRGIIQSGRIAETSRTQRSVSATLRWDHPAALFEFGAPPHEINGNPILSFVWEDPPEWVKSEFRREGDGWRVFFPSVQNPGLPAGRWLRGALNKVRFELQRGQVRL